MRRFARHAVAALILLVSACGMPRAASPEEVATAVAGTLTADAPTPAPPADTVTPMPSAGPGGAAGSICYPSETIPPMTAYFQDVASGEVTTLDIQDGQSSYEVALPPATYIAFAWLPGFSIGVAYTLAVPCGLQAECDNHSLIAFTVAPGAFTDGIDLCDWYGPEGSVPLPPGVVVAETSTATPTMTQPPPPPTSVQLGGLAGSLSYPSEGIPQLVVVAFNIDTGYWWWVGTVVNQASYGFSDIPAGRYQVVAYAPSGLEAGYASGTSLRTVVVQGGQTTSGINLSDWYPGGTYRAKPGGINYP